MFSYVTLATQTKKMSKTKLDSDGFQLVFTSKKRSPKNKPTKIPPRNILVEKQNIKIDTEKALRQIHSAVEELRVSKYLEDVTKSVSTALQSRTVVEIICFGLGHVGECNISRYQLALLLCLKDSCSPTKVLVHDPIFYIGECEVLKRLGLEVIERNSEGSYIISESDTTLVYLPHCPKQLTNNFLWSNWSPKLQSCIIICNSIASLIENQPNRILLETVPYIHKIAPFTTEITLENSFKYTDIFNDTSLHYFPKKILDIDPDFWIKGDKPSYENAEEFITSLMIEKLNV